MPTGSPSDRTSTAAARVLAAANLGKYSFTAKFLTPGAGQSLSVADGGDGSITGSLTGITVT